MKKKMKRPLAVLLALIMMFSTVSGTGLNLSAEELQTSEVEILTTEDSAADTEEDKSGDTKDINQEEAPEAENESEGDELTESEESEDEVEPTGDIESEKGVQPASEEAEPAAQDIGDIESEADVQPASEEEDKSEPVTETEDDADDEESEKTETPAEITRYDYKSDEVNVLVTLTDPADLPDAAELVVEPITLQREAQKNIEEAAAEEGIFVEEIKAFDIKFMLDGEEVQPGATVKVSVSVPEFKPSEEASAVYHVDENNEVENMESEVAADGEVVFDAPHFSTYVIVDGSIINDATKKITVTLKHYNKKGYSASAATSPTEAYKLYLDDVIEVPVGGEIYNYIKADNWKPDTVVVDYVHDSSATDVTYTSSADLKEISLTEDATVWVYYTPERSRFYGDVGFYDYTNYTTIDNQVYSINDEIEKYTLDENVEKILIVGDAKYDSRTSSTSTGIYNNRDKIFGNWNRVGSNYCYTESIYGQDKDGKVQYLDADGKVLFKYPEPGLFDTTSIKAGESEVYLRRYYSDYEVGFTRDGNTYTFDQVQYTTYNDEGEKQTQQYNRGDDSDYGKSPTWDSNGKYFYPLDNSDYSSEKCANATSSTHNRFWGMRYDLTFTIGDYVGDMIFESTTTEDFLVVLDGDKVIAETIKTWGNTTVGPVDLWEILFSENENYSEEYKYKLSNDEKKETHTLTILYIDRHVNANTNVLDTQCAINFTLPNVKLKAVAEVDDTTNIVVDPKTTSLTLKTVESTDPKLNGLSGAVFQLKNTLTAAMETLTTTEDGVTFQGLEVGEYQLMLANAPDNCVADVNEWKVTIVNQEGNLIISMIEEETGKTVTPTNGIYLIGVTEVIGTKLVLRTVSNKEGASPLGGARFQLESDSTAEEKYSETKTSDFVTGEISFNGLSEGGYKLTHIKAPKGCQLEGVVSEWQVTITESSGNYSISMKYKTADEDGVESKAADEDGVYVYKYEVDEREYVKPEEALTYDKTAKVVDWDERTYEIDISATALEVESIQQIDTTYGMFVFDKSSSMFNSIIDDKILRVGGAGKTFKEVKSELEKKGRTVVYRVENSNTGSYGTGADYILYRDDDGMNGWYMYSCKNATWTEMKDETVMPNYLIYQTLKFDLLRDVAVTYVKNLFENAPQSKLGITTFYSSGNRVKELASVSESDDTFNLSILEEIFKILYVDQGTCLGTGLELAYNEFFTKKDGETESAYEIAKKNNIPMYVIAVSDGDVTDHEKSEQFARALKEKGIKVYTIVTNTAGSDKDFLKRIASFGCAYETSDVRQLSEIFSQIQKEVSVPTYTNITVKDAIDDRFVILDDDENETPITEGYYDKNAKSVCIKNCESDCTCNFKAIKVERGEKTGFVYYENGKQYIQWVNQTISETENNWSIKVKAREDYIGGNNVTTNIAAESMIKTANKVYTLPNPTVNVKVDLKVYDHVYMLYKGEKVPTNDDVLNKLFDRSINSKYSKDAFVKYGIMERVDETDPISLNWYSNEGCTLQVDLANEKADSGKLYYLKVTYDTTEPSNESNANTTDSNGVVHYVGTPVAENVYRQTAVNSKNDRLLYGTYTINVWELIKRDPETNTLLSGAEFKLSSDANTYTGGSNDLGSVVWDYNKDETSQSILAPINELDIAAGKYTLTETRAPEKYKLIEKEWTAIKTAANGWDLSQNNIGHEQVTKDGITKVYINNKKAPSAITITKTVTGNLGSNTKEFTFTVTLTDADNNAIEFPAATQNDSYKVDLTETNKATFKLTDGGSITIDDLPVEAKLTILESTEDLSESDGNNYTVTVKKDNADVTNSYNTETGITVNITDTSSTVAFTNNRSATLGTGILSDTPKVQNTLLAVTFAASVIGILAYMDRKRSKYDYRR